MKEALISREFLLVVGVLGALSACDAEDDTGYGPHSPPAKEPYTCQASIMPGHLEYTVDGDILHIMQNGHRAKLERVASGDPGKPVFGTWHINTERDQLLGVTLISHLMIEPNRVTVIADCDLGTVSATAEASARAVITDDSIEVLDAAKDREVVYRYGFYERVRHGIVHGSAGGSDR